MSNVTGFEKASQHPDKFVREAENIAIILKRLLEDLDKGVITAEIMGHTYQKFCVDLLRRVVQEETKELRAELLASQARELRIRMALQYSDGALEAILENPDIECRGDEDCDHCVALDSQREAKIALETPAPDLKELVGKLVGALKTTVGHEPFSGLHPRPASDALAETKAVRLRLGLL